MREILFRAKRIDNGEWTEGYVFELQPSQYVICDRKQYDRASALPVWEFLRYCTHEINPETLCQYTGLKDKNGNRIWENDIVVCKQYIDGNFIDYHIEFGFVEMKHGAYGLHRDRPDAYYRPFKDWLEDYEYEVLGNVFDNPELLKGE